MSNPVNVLQALREWLVEESAKAENYLASTHDSDPVAREKVATLKSVMDKLDQLEDEDFSKPLWQNYEGMRFLQAALYVVCGHSFVGRSNAEHPKGNYVDDRVSLKRYTKKDADNIRKALIETAEAIGFDPANLPGLPNFHNSGVW